MLPLLMKDHLMIAFVALIVIYYLAADLCLSPADSLTSSANVDNSDNGSRTARLHTDSKLSLVVCN